MKKNARTPPRKAAARKLPPSSRTAPAKAKARSAAVPATRRSRASGAPAGRASAAPEAPAVRLARVAKGKKPLYFSDPAIDKVLWMTLTLMEELSVTRDRLDAVEDLLESRRVLKIADVDAYRPAGAAAERRSRRRAAYVDRMLRAAQAELEELTGREVSRTDDEAVAAVES